MTYLVVVGLGVVLLASLEWWLGRNDKRTGNQEEKCSK